MHPSSTPRIDPLLSLLARHDVRFVLTGSVALMAMGVELTPGDLDVTPSLDLENLKALAALLGEIEARPTAFGHWVDTETGERKWVQEETSAEALEAWRPDPGDVTSLDHLFRTLLGDFDVVPELVGTYEHLMVRAVSVEAFGRRLWIPHVDDLLDRITVPRRKKDVARVKALREIQRIQATTFDFGTSDP